MRFLFNIQRGRNTLSRFFFFINFFAILFKAPSEKAPYKKKTPSDEISRGILDMGYFMMG